MIGMPGVRLMKELFLSIQDLSLALPAQDQRALLRKTSYVFLYSQGLLAFKAFYIISSDVQVFTGVMVNLMYQLDWAK